MQQDIRKVYLEKRPSKSPNWYIRFWIRCNGGNGWKEIRESTRTSVKKKAEQIRRNKEQELAASTLTDGMISWDDFIQQFLSSQRSRKPKTTVDCYAFSLKTFTGLMNPALLSGITRAVLDRFVTMRIEKVAKATVNKDLRHLKVALKWAEQQEHISKAPSFSGIFIKEDRKQPTFIPESDFIMIIQVLENPELKLQVTTPEWWRAWLYVAYYGGLRRGELFGLVWEDIDFDFLEIRVKAPTSKSRKERVIPIQPGIADILNGWKTIADPPRSKTPVFPWDYDNYRNLYHDWHHLMDVAEFEKEDRYTLKDFRSSCASALIAAQTPTAVVQRILGHESMSTTANYYINAQPALRQAVQNRPIRIE
ncbi:site-specific tyrosine recombinase XerC [Polystyrenella longa]|uniref:Site-specific tyrosine recombinase XerC n=2 Tax=Polystyrenella longa TaxID=2528007 RepID=A0A518CTC8_9PLAN|nr:site-specific tyrosine recombinase XerC [Polystyrenella longa]